MRGLAIALGCAGSGETDAAKGAASGPTNDPAVRKTIESADSAFTVAFKNGDAAAAASFYAEDAISRPPNSEAMSGKAAIEKGFGEMFKSVGKVVDFSAVSKDLDIYADHAVEVGEYSMSVPARRCERGNERSRWIHQLLEETERRLVEDLP